MLLWLALKEEVIKARRTLMEWMLYHPDDFMLWDAGSGLGPRALK